MGVRCFWLEPSDRLRVSLRRFRHSDDRSACPDHGYHTAKVAVGEAPDGEPQSLKAYETDPRWPKACSCGYEFTTDDQWQVFTETIYVRQDTGAELVLREAPPGAMWDADWMGDDMKGPDGRSLMVVCPDGFEWAIDGPANNCTRPGDKTHRCWLRTGEPPRITVSKKAPGMTTCAAGAGSIATPGYHGFLRDGEFT